MLTLKLKFGNTKNKKSIHTVYFKYLEFIWVNFPEKKIKNDFIYAFDKTLCFVQYSIMILWNTYKKNSSKIM